MPPEEEISKPSNGSSLRIRYNLGLWTLWDIRRSTWPRLVLVETFSGFCERNPWKVAFRRNDRGTVVSAELTFLRRAAVIEKTR
jgi:hypothetical protein